MHLTRTTAVALSALATLAMAGTGSVVLRSDHPSPPVETAGPAAPDLIIHGVVDPFASERELARAPDGFRWVAVDVELRNPGPGAVRASSLIDFTVRDAAGITYRPVATGDDMPSPEGVVAPGTSVRGTVVFELPATARGSRLVFTGHAPAVMSSAVID